MKKFFVFLCLIFSIQLQSQDIESSFEYFIEAPREEIYAHLNKSTYIVGEHIWYKLYVFSKSNKELFDGTANIYVTLSKPNGDIVSKALISAYNGTAKGQIKLEDSLTSGNYIFKAYTNFMRNFEMENLHTELAVKILNAKDKSYDKADADSAIDVQILPESGNLLVDSKNTVGIIAKNRSGNIVPYLQLSIFENDQLLTEIELNDKGVGLFEFVPVKNSKYSATYTYNGKAFKVNLPDANSKGVILNISTDSTFGLQLVTNDATLSDIVGKPYKLVFHNGSELNTFSFNYQNAKVQKVQLNSNDLFAGTIVFTLFDDNDNVIAERLYFNHNNLPIYSLDPIDVEKSNDSIDVKIPINLNPNSELSSLSASVLPAESKSYKHHENSISALYLKPFLRTPIENAPYYFYDVTDLKKKELNELLLVQGWSRYDWTKIFNYDEELPYEFEYGIDYNLVSNNKDQESFLIYPNQFSKTEIVEIDALQTLERKGLFPFGDEKLRIKAINKKPNQSTGLAISFKPNAILELDKEESYIPHLITGNFDGQQYVKNVLNLKETQVLDEVLVKTKREYTRIEKLQNKSAGKIFEFDDDMKRRYRTFAQFISSHGFRVETTKDTTADGGLSLFRIETMNYATINGTIEPVIYLNGSYLIDFNILNEFSMRDIDYIEINRGGVGEGIRGGAGVIRIQTKTDTRRNKKPEKLYQEYKIPLTFDTPVEYYSPKYGDFNSAFFRDYGVITWIPNLKIDENNVSFKLPDYGFPIKVYLEGVINGGELVSEQLKID